MLKAVLEKSGLELCVVERGPILKTISRAIYVETSGTSVFSEYLSCACQHTSSMNMHVVMNVLRIVFMPLQRSVYLLDMDV